MIQGIVTTLSLIIFIAIVIWAFSKHKKKDFEEAANLPFDDEVNKTGGKDNHG